ncbi:uncharacterized protein LOC121504808 [Cheilinus undulatus]|uniref:uncharacterized protein LOC121504808 n=1 Tax=Cheilinus undulatus TaxID=241271 RepID=UPI001BD6A893|nr:uncharacterized protein LOC121504808 [Cheilinus undulatus]
MLLLLSCVIIAGITTEGSLMTHHGVKSSSICLQAGHSSAHENVIWSFNSTVFVYGKKLLSNNTGKMDYNPGNNTLCIDKLAETDSGDYKVTIYHMELGQLKQSSETHQLMVHEAVPTPVIRMSVMGSNSSAAFCIISINCSVLDEWLWTICDEDSCRTNQSFFNKFNISVSADSRSVYCSGHNLVSTKNVSARMDQTCHRKISIEDEETAFSVIVIIIAVGAGVAICALSCLIKGLFSTKCNQTSSAPLIHSQPIEDQPQPVNRGSTSSSQPDAAYENVDVTQPSQINNRSSNPREELRSAESWTVDTIYSVLQLPNAASSLKNRDRDNSPRENELSQEASTSASVILRGPDAPMEVETLYSVLKKPK